MYYHTTRDTIYIYLICLFVCLFVCLFADFILHPHTNITWLVDVLCLPAVAPYTDNAISGGSPIGHSEGTNTNINTYTQNFG